ncbi:hypothetical protein ACSAZL_12495 [Methanosarcina sp. T3]|uniref:hypothetical protein n=1 Tax=Methanosarcina sp. T3 TaxID=3439062 RepID=UPI003F844FC7
MDNDLIYGFLGGIVGGICVNILTFHYTRRIETKEKAKDSQKEGQKRIIDKLKEIKFTFENYLSSDRIRYKEMKNECFIFSNQLTNILSQTVNDISDETSEDLQKLSLELDKLGDYSVTMDDDFSENCEFIIICRSIIRDAEKIMIDVDNY